MSKRLVGVFSLTVLAGLFMFGRTAGEVEPAPEPTPQETQLNELISLLHEEPASNRVVLEFVGYGLPALDSLMTDFGQYPFFERHPELREQLLEQAPTALGQAMEEDVYVSNVLRLVKAYGTPGLGRVVAHLPNRVRRQFHLSSPAFFSLGEGLTKPLLLAHLFRNAPPEITNQWLNQWASEERQADILGRGPEMSLATSAAVGFVAGLAANAAYDYLTDGEFGEAAIPNVTRRPPEYFSSLLDVESRARAKLARLTPNWNPTINPFKYGPPWAFVGPPPYLATTDTYIWEALSNGATPTAPYRPIGGE